MHEFKKGAEAEYLWSNNWIEILSVLLLGFGVSLLLGYGLSWVMRVWNRGKQPQGESEQLERLKRVEQNDRLVQLGSLTEEIQHLQNRIDGLKQERENYERGIEETSKQRLDALIEAHKHPIQVEIARLNTEKENLQNQITELNEQVESIQKEINQCEAEIETLLKRQRERVIDVKKLEAQANEFVSGWCRYVAQSKTELPADVGTQIKDIQSLAHETLETYKASLTTV
jgi:chromosome segregation ATPase